MLAGRRLFRGKSELETLNNVLEKKVPPPSAHRPDVPASLDAVVMRALERDRNERYPTGQAMADDLETVLRETGYHSKMLADLLRESFGSDLSKSQETLSSVTPEMLASLSADRCPHTRRAADGFRGAIAPRASWKRVAAIVGVGGGGVALGGLLLARGGGGSSQAQERAEAPPAGDRAAAHRADPHAADAGAASRPRPAPVANPPAEAGPKPPRAPARTKGEAIAATIVVAARHARRPIASTRGLSIDPFAEAARAGAMSSDDARGDGR